MQRRGVLISVWVLSTAAATLIAWAAVNQVTQEVSPQAVLPLPRTAAIADVTASAAPSEDRQVARRQRSRTPTEQEQRNARPAEGQASAGEVREDDQAVEPAGDEEPAQPAAETVTEAYDLAGGVVTVRYSGTSTELVQASPESGYVAEVNDQGPGKVDVRFRSDDHESRLVTRVRNGEPDPDIEERPR